MKRKNRYRPRKVILYLFCIVFSFLSPKSVCFGQDFNEFTFVKGYYTDLNDSVTNGLLKFSVYTPALLQFKKDKKDKAVKLKPSEIKHFSNEKADVYSLFNVDVFGINASRQRLDEVFGILLEKGEVTAFMVYNTTVLNGKTYQNIVLQRSPGQNKLTIPVSNRLNKDKKSQIINDLIEFFNGDESLKNQLMELNDKDKSFIEVLSIIQDYNKKMVNSYH